MSGVSISSLTLRNAVLHLLTWSIFPSSSPPSLLLSEPEPLRCAVCVFPLPWPGLVESGLGPKEKAQTPEKVGTWGWGKGRGRKVNEGKARMLGNLFGRIRGAASHGIVGGATATANTAVRNMSGSGGRKRAENVRKINPRMSPQEASSIARSLYDLLNLHGPLSISHAWLHAQSNRQK
ncbi:hypothetical protein TIFTF001_003863 [Ficus carica]|uniref:Uncharacterized protein n=1 Tax=Ficus carica TaxID=3494 RepID=A0AA87ZTG2_FICCA|nr:hypothetical protein TIFTF001_003863 [Ficus carica]